jgi:tripartite-type tricarboxylate transporter receptor subunit TctC
VTDLIAGNVQAGFFVPGNVQGFVKEGRLKLLASTGTKRFPSTPDVPTLAESGLKDFEATSWIGLLAPAGTPPAIINRYHDEMVRILQSPEIQKRLHEMEFEIIASSPKQFSDWIGTEIVRWGKVIKATGAKAE